MTNKATATEDLRISRSTWSTGLRWVLTSGIATALLALWATLLGLLYRMGWLSVFGVSQDLFFPSSATELTYWGYIALLDLWSLATKEYFGWLILLGASTAAAVCVGIALALAWVRYGSKAADLLDRRSTKLSFEFAKVLGFAAIYPLAIFYLATTLLLLPFPAYERGKSSAEQNIRRYELEIAAGTRSCHSMDGPKGEIGKCPMVIAQTTARIAFLDGKEVHVVPAEGIRIRWTLPTHVPEVAAATDKARH